VSRKSGPKQEANGTWSFVVDKGPGFNRKGEWRQRRQARGLGFKTRKDAQDEMDRVRVRTREGTYIAPSTQRFAEFADEWLAAVRVRLQSSTLESYERNLRVHIIPAIGGLKLQAIDPARLMGLYADLLASGRKSAKEGQPPGGLSPRTVRYIATIVRRILADAVEWDRLLRNPADRAKPPSASSAKPPEMQVWDAPTLSAFLERVADDRYSPTFLLLATTGMRRGEALGLRWSDVDLEAGRAAIRQTVTAVNHQIVIAPRTKTGKARNIEVDGGTLAALRARRKRQAEERLMIGAGYQDHDLVFCHPDGCPYHPERFSREFDRRVERFGLPRIRLHDLRHTWATLALSAGVPAKVVSERLGHSSIAITLDIYSHATPAMSSDAAERVAGLILGGNL
jgi:integrase